MGSMSNGINSSSRELADHIESDIVCGRLMGDANRS
jgi:hypothetical protein